MTRQLLMKSSDSLSHHLYASDEMDVDEGII